MLKEKYLRPLKTQLQRTHGGTTKNKEERLWAHDPHRCNTEQFFSSTFPGNNCHSHLAVRLIRLITV